MDTVVLICSLNLKKTFHDPVLLYSHHLLAKVHESKGDFRAALRHEKERYGIYRKQVNGYKPIQNEQICFALNLI